MRCRSRTALALASVTTSLVAPAAAASASSADELVRQARAHEAAREDDLAVRRYMEALSVEPTCRDAWLGLGALRMRLADAAEAERVYAAALERAPSLHEALGGLARARWALGLHVQAEADLDAYANAQGSVGALRELASWYGADGRTPAQLATWRRILAMSVDDALAAREARRMVRALIVVVDGADPASSPIEPDFSRRALASIARRGG